VVFPSVHHERYPRPRFTASTTIDLVLLIHEENAAARRAAERAGFGDPVAWNELGYGIYWKSLPLGSTGIDGS